jgi:hypothetical protein
MAEVVNVEDATKKQARVLVLIRPYPGLLDGESVRDTSSIDAFVVFPRLLRACDIRDA